MIKPTDVAPKTATVQFDFQSWNTLLGKYVDGEGRVDYARLRATPADLATLERLYAEISRTRPESLPTRQAREAFLIDAYNVCIWKNILDRAPNFKSVNDAKLSFFVFTKFLIGGKEVSLNALESDWIRPVFKDPRVHMALNCASGGCPILPAEAFTPEKVDEQLDREAKRFCNETRNVSYDKASNTVNLSHIFDWYAADFDKKPLPWINKHRAADAQIPENAKVKFVDYDWRLNDRSLERR